MKNIAELMSMAESVSKMSKDSSKIGAVALSKDNRVLGVGFNGYPSGYDDTDLNDKYDKVIHAEMNAIINSNCTRGDIHAMVIYGLPPCPDCMKLLVAFGIKLVLYKTDSNIKSLAKWEEAFYSKKKLHPNLTVIKYD